LPNCPEAAYAMLACTRIGLVHSIVFAGFSSESLAARISDARSTVVITADSFHRGGKSIYLKKLVDEALKDLPFVHSVLVSRRSSNLEGGNQWIEPRDKNLRELMVLF